MTNWQQLGDAMARCYDSGTAPRFWLRDDDATAPNNQLEQLLAAANAHEIPVSLAAIPAQADASLADLLPRSDHALLPHGYRHVNYAPQGEKKAEFGAHRPVFEMLADIAIGWTRMQTLFPDHAVAVFVPPWNRISPQLVPRLVNAGLYGWSGYGVPTMPTPVAHLRQTNTHVDLIDWRGSRGFIGVSAALTQIIALLSDQSEGRFSEAAIGLLSHHKVMENESLTFLRKLFDVTKCFPAPPGCATVTWRSARQVFLS